MTRANWRAAGRALPGCLLSVGGPYLVFAKPHILGAMVGFVLAVLAPTLHGLMLPREPSLAVPKAELLAAIERRPSATRRLRVVWDPRSNGGIAMVGSSAARPYLQVPADFDANDPALCDLTVFRARQLVERRYRLPRFVADLMPAFVGIAAATFLLIALPEHPAAAMVVLLAPRSLPCCAFNRLFKRQAISIDRAALAAGFTVDTIRRSLQVPNTGTQRLRRRNARIRLVEARGRALDSAAWAGFATDDQRTTA